MSWDLEDANKQRKDDTEATSEQPPRRDAAPHSAGRRDPLREALEHATPLQVEIGEIVKGVVAAVDNQCVSVDIGSKYEGIVPISEFAASGELPAVDDEVEVAVVRIDDDKSQVLLSKRRADYERVWNHLAEAVENEQVVEALVTERVKGGLRVDVGVPGFVPGSHVAAKNLRNLERFVGQSLRLRVLEADRRSKKVILSHRLVVEEEREKRRQETLSQLQEGLECEGKVRSLTNYGAFIDLGGVDGLLHVSEMAWTRVKHPSEVLSVGDTVRVVVLDIDPDSDRISLSRRQILPDPWKQVAGRVRVGQMVKARISRVVRTGAFAQLLDHDIEGFIPIGEMSEKRVAEASDVVTAGQALELKVIEMRPSARRMTLSLAAAEQEKERQEYRQYMAGQESARVTLGDQFGDILQQVAAPDGSEQQDSEPAEQPEKPHVEQDAEAAAEEATDEAEEVTEEVAESAEADETEAAETDDVEVDDEAETGEVSAEAGVDDTEGDQAEEVTKAAEAEDADDKTDEAADNAEQTDSETGDEDATEESAAEDAAAGKQ